MPRNRKKRRQRAPAHQARHVRPRFSIRNWPAGPPPALGTVRTWLRQAEDAGMVERKGVGHTGKPGRPPVLWGLTDAGRQRAADVTELAALYGGVTLGPAQAAGGREPKEKRDA
jgi:DNA-binding PadR family transcriptional regulator